MLDLDHFKSINDSYGHQAGDTILKDLAESLRGSLRKSDTICRLGGEEFAVIMPGASSSAARRVAERIRRKVAATRSADCPEASVTISIGIRSLRHPEDIERLMEDADRALYRAKFLGRNRVEVYSDQPLKIIPGRTFEPEMLRAAAGLA
jgi:diguanylate cyclase (GGDEF)-like protein